MTQQPPGVRQVEIRVSTQPFHICQKVIFVSVLFEEIGPPRRVGRYQSSLKEVGSEQLRKRLAPENPWGHTWVVSQGSA